MAESIAITTGDPAGIGPDICLSAIAAKQLEDVVLIGDRSVMEKRAAELKLDVDFDCCDTLDAVLASNHEARLLHVDVSTEVVAGKPNAETASGQLRMLEIAIDGCLDRSFAAMVTAPIAKHVINDAGFEFTGHTEFIARRCEVEQPVMMLVTENLRVALVTTHVPLREVADAITAERLRHVLLHVDFEMRNRFAVASPRITVLGLNPHAGEQGYLGSEEQEIMLPVIEELRDQGLKVSAPVAADTAFTLPVRASTDVFVAMYHDQGLPVLKFTGFSRAVNVTLGLPIVRTSVDHGTAFDLAGSGRAQPDSLLAAVRLARELSRNSLSA